MGSVGGKMKTNTVRLRRLGRIAPLALVRLVLLFVLLLLLPSRRAAAQNPRNVLIGGRTATMGGAGTASGNDSAMPYLNPAGLAGLPGDVFAVSASVYSWTKWSTGSALAPNGFPSAFGPASNDASTTEGSGLLELPSAVMYFKHIPISEGLHAATGMSLVIPSSSGIDLISTRKADFSSKGASYRGDVSVMERSTDYYFGPTFALNIRDRVRLGATIYGLYTKSARASKYTDTFLLSNGTFPSQATSTFSEDSSSMSLVAVLGVQANLTGNVWAGAAIATPSLGLSGGSTQTALSSFNGVRPPSTQATFESTTVTSERSHRSGRPLRANVGLAYEDRKRFSLTGDLGVYFQRGEAIVTEGDEEHTEIIGGQPTRTYMVASRKAQDLEAVFDVSVGGEVVISPFAVRVGFFTDLSQRKPFETPNKSDGLRLRGDRVGGTLGLGTILGSFDSTLGIAYAHTSGQLNALDFTNPGSPGYPVEAVANTFTFILSGAVTTAEAKKTIEDTLPKGMPKIPLQ